MYRKSKAKPTKDNLDKYKNYKNLYNSLLRKAEKQYIHNLFESHKNDCKKIWGLINDTIGRKSRKCHDILAFFKENGFLYDNPSLISRGFNEYYTSVGEKLAAELPKNQIDPLQFLGPKPSAKLRLRPITEKELIKIIGG